MAIVIIPQRMPASIPAMASSTTAQFLGNFDYALLMPFIQENYRDITLKSLAERFHYNQSHLSVLIHKNMGKKFSEIIRSIRMQHAAEFLQKTNFDISKIADLVGYDSVDYFSRVFKEFYNKSPSGYRKAIKQK